MKKIINECCDCAAPGYPCRGDLCPRTHVEVHYCDKCDPKCEEPLEEVYQAEGYDLCEECLKEMFRKE